jgi:hypothetical protein
VARMAPAHPVTARSARCTVAVVAAVQLLCQADAGPFAAPGLKPLG